MSLLLLGVGGATFNPLSLSPTAWYDDLDISTLFQDSALTTPVTANNDPVGGRKDKSGNGWHATQATSGLRGQYHASALNGKPGVKQDGTDDFWTLASLGIPAATMQICTLYAVISGYSGTDPMGVFGMDGGGAGNLGAYYYRINASKSNILKAFDSNIGSGTNNAVNLEVVTYSSPNAVFRSQRAANGSVSVAKTFTNQTDILGAQRDTTGPGTANEYFNGYIHELIVYPSVHSAGTITTIENYLWNKWGLS